MSPETPEAARIGSAAAAIAVTSATIRTTVRERVMAASV
jgi:hypothetical protein